MTREVLYHLLVSAGIFLTIILAGLILRRFLFGALQRWSRKTETLVDDILIEALTKPWVVWSVALGLYVSIGTSDLPARYVSYTFKGLHILVILSVTFVLANLASRFLAYSIQQTDVPLPVSGLSHAVIKGAVIAVGVLILLGNLGISITPLLTALGVGGLAVALALQDTLANLFAGIHILIEKGLRIGDYVRLEGGQEGRVVDIGWRTVRILLPPNNMVIVPNGKLAQSILTNYSLPEKKMALRVPVSVSYQADPERVEAILVDEAERGAGEIPGLLIDPRPLARLTGFGESALEFTLICHVTDFEAQGPVQDTLRKRIVKRFHDEGIEIPFPHRTVDLRPSKGEGA